MIVPIQSITLAADAATVTFSAIPQTFTDLILRFSNRSTTTALSESIRFTFNGSAAANYSTTYFQRNTSSASAISGRDSGLTFLNALRIAQGNGATSYTFGSHEVYIPQYATTVAKPIGIYGATETNAIDGFLVSHAGRCQLAEGYTSISMVVAGYNWLAGSTFHLYGVKATA